MSRKKVGAHSRKAIPTVLAGVDKFDFVFPARRSVPLRRLNIQRKNLRLDRARRLQLDQALL